MNLDRLRNGRGVSHTMRRRERRQHESGQVLVLVLILLAMAGGAFWYAKHARAAKEKGALAFATDVSNRVILGGDKRLLDLTLSPQAKVTYMPSWRERLFEMIRAQGNPLSQVRVTGDVRFQHYFLDPQGHFRGEVDYANGPAYLEINISRPGVVWQIDQINWIWQRPPEPPPTPPPAPIATATPSPVPPNPEPARRKRR